MDFFKSANTGVLNLAPYQPGKPVEELERELGLKQIVKLASNENPLGPTPQLQVHLGEILKDCARYPDGSAFQLKQKLSEQLGVATDCLTVGNGSNDVLELLARVFLKPGHNTVVSQHAFVVYGLVTQSLGATLREVPCVDYQQDLDATLAMIDDQTRIVFIANPNNPTGTWVRGDALERFLKAVPATTLVVLDEAYVEYVDDPAYPNGLGLLDQFSNLVVTRTDVADLMNRIRQPFNVNSMALAAGLIALEDPGHVAQGVAVNRQGLQVLNAGLADLSLAVIPSVGNFVCFDLGQDALPIYQALLMQGVIVRPIGVYGLPQHLRVSVGTPEENRVFLDALGRVLIP